MRLCGHFSSKFNASMRTSRTQPLTRLDRLAFAVGLLGYALLIAGIGFIYWPAALIVAGSGLLGWSYLTARAVARSRSQVPPS
jgi:uncharacterized membrane protein HdeD (DUF308 family)